MPPHSEDIGAHVKSVHEDMEYWRTKRLEPRLFRFIRRGKITSYDILSASDRARSHSWGPADANTDPPAHLEDRVAALEMKLGEFIKGINISVNISRDLISIEDQREESGIYDDSLRFEHRNLSGSDEERIAQLERFLMEDMVVMQTLLIALVELGLITESKLDEMLAAPNPPSFENGAKIVAKAWLDAAFKAKLMANAKETLRDNGFALNRTPKLVVLEDTDSVRNVIVCTLCSCYPYELLGNPPWWYKDESYREAIVQDPRKTLEKMFKLKVPSDVELRVYDSTSDIRYMVLPKRPDGTEILSEDRLAGIVTNESLIGVGELLPTNASSR